MTKAPKAGTGGGGKQRPQRPQRPHHKAAKPKKPAAPSGGASHQKTGKQHHGASSGGARSGGRKTKRGTPLHDSVACCAAEALAMSLWLAGWPVSEADVLALYQLTAPGPDEGASIEDTLEAAAEHGLAGVRCKAWSPNLEIEWPQFRYPVILGVDWPGEHTVLDDGSGWWSWGEHWQPFPRATVSEAWVVSWPELS